MRLKNDCGGGSGDGCGCIVVSGVGVIIAATSLARGILVGEAVNASTVFGIFVGVEGFGGKGVGGGYSYFFLTT